MFERLKRAKSFIGKSKPPQELDLPENSHLRRTIPINTEVLFGVKQTSEKNVAQNNNKNFLRNDVKIIRKKLEENVKSKPNSDEQQSKSQIKTFTLQEHAGFSKAIIYETNYKPDKDKKVLRSKSARESRAQFMKRYQNKYQINEDR